MSFISRNPTPVRPPLLPSSSVTANPTQRQINFQAWAIDLQRRAQQHVARKILGPEPK